MPSTKATSIHPPSPPRTPDPNLPRGTTIVTEIIRDYPARYDGPSEPIHSMEIVDPVRSFERVYLHGSQLYVALGAITVATFLLMLDTSVIATAIPSITDDFNSLPDLGWYSGVYGLACAALQPLTGKIFSKFPVRATYIVWFLIFMAGSAICGLSKSSVMFIIGRAVAGIGGAGITTGALTITSTIAPPERANVLVGIVMGFSHLGIVMGPVFGGIFSTYTNWRWCFLINLPIGAFVLPCLLFIRLPEQTAKTPVCKVMRSIHRQLDLVGFILFTPFTIQLLLALQYGASGAHAWNSPVVVGLFCGSGGAFIAWAFWNRYVGDDSIIPVSILKMQIVWTAILTQCLLMTSVYIVTIYLAMYLQAIKDNSPIQSGLIMLAGILTQLLFTILVARIIVRTGLVSHFAILAAVITVASNAAYTQMSVDSGPGAYIGFQVLNGIGRGLGMQSQITAINLSLEPAQNAVAMAMMMFFQMLTTSIMQVVANVVFLERLKSHLALYAPHADAGAIIAAGATNFRNVVSSGDLGAVLIVYSNSITYVFWVVAVLGAAAFMSAVLMGNVKPPVVEGRSRDEEDGEH